MTLATSGVAQCDVAPDDSASQAIVTKFLDASKTQQERLRGAQMEVRIAAKLPRLAKQGELKALRSISKFGKITYQGLGFSGDNTIKSQVISRFIVEDTQPHDSAITPANYKFKHKAAIETNGHRVEIFQLTPRRKAEGLFKGELWLDAATGMPVREAGRLVKSSVFLKKIEFVSSYEIQDGVAIPKHFESTVDTRLVGRAELSIDFSNYSRLEAIEDDAAGSGSLIPDCEGLSTTPLQSRLGNVEGLSTAPLQSRLGNVEGFCTAPLQSRLGSYSRGSETK